MSIRSGSWNCITRKKAVPRDVRPEAAVTDDLAAFLRARLDEDEAAANATTPGPWMAGAERAHLVDNVVYGQSEWPDHIQQVCNVNYAQHKAGNATHIARHDPARALREVAA